MDPASSVLNSSMRCWLSYMSLPFRGHAARAALAEDVPEVVAGVTDLEVEIGPYGHHLVLELRGVRRELGSRPSRIMT